MLKIYSKTFIITLLFFSIYNICEAGIKRDIALIRLELEMENTPDLFISDAYTPMTHFKKNDLQFSVTPVYLKLPLGSNKKFENYRDDLTCKAISMNAGYAFTNRFFTNMIYTYADISGTLGYDEGGSPLVRINGDQIIQSYLVSAGYDLWGSDTTSIPLMFGAGQRFTNINMDVKGIWYPSDCVVKSDSNTALFFLGIALSKKITIFSAVFKLTPYLYYFYGDIPVFKFTSESNPSFDYSAKGLRQGGFVDGFHFSYLIDGLGFTLSVNSAYSDYYYNSFDNLFLDGLHMLYIGVKELAYTLSVSYTF